MQKHIMQGLQIVLDLDELRFKFGVKFDMNLFNGKSTEHKLKANDKQKTISQNKYEDKLIQLRNDITLFYNLFVDIKNRIRKLE